MGTDVVQKMLDTVPFPALAIDAAERISAANTEALTLLGQQIVARNFVTMLRQPALLDAVEQVMRDGAPRRAAYLSNDFVNRRFYPDFLKVLEDVGVGHAVKKS